MTREKNIEVEVEGLKIGMRFDNWALKESQNKSKCRGVIELFNRIESADGDVLIIAIMEGVNEYNHFLKKQEVIDQRTASEYIDKLGGFAKVIELITEGIQQFQSPNQTPPETAGEISQ